MASGRSEASPRRGSVKGGLDREGRGSCAAEAMRLPHPAHCRQLLPTLCPFLSTGAEHTKYPLHGPSEALGFGTVGTPGAAPRRGRRVIRALAGPRPWLASSAPRASTG